MLWNKRLAQAALEPCLWCLARYVLAAATLAMALHSGTGSDTPTAAIAYQATVRCRAVEPGCQPHGRWQIIVTGTLLLVAL